MAAIIFVTILILSTSYVDAQLKHMRAHGHEHVKKNSAKESHSQVKSGGSDQWTVEDQSQTIEDPVPFLRCFGQVFIIL